MYIDSLVSGDDDFPKTILFLGTRQNQLIDIKKFIVTNSLMCPQIANRLSNVDLSSIVVIFVCFKNSHVTRLQVVLKTSTAWCTMLKLAWCSCFFRILSAFTLSLGISGALLSCSPLTYPRPPRNKALFFELINHWFPFNQNGNFILGCDIGRFGAKWIFQITRSWKEFQLF